MKYKEVIKNQTLEKYLEVDKDEDLCDVSKEGRRQDKD